MVELMLLRVVYQLNERQDGTKQNEGISTDDGDNDYMWHD